MQIIEINLNIILIILHIIIKFRKINSKKKIIISNTFYLFILINLKKLVNINKNITYINIIYKLKSFFYF